MDNLVLGRKSVGLPRRQLTRTCTVSSSEGERWSGSRFHPNHPTQINQQPVLFGLHQFTEQTTLARVLPILLASERPNSCMYVDDEAQFSGRSPEVWAMVTQLSRHLDILPLEFSKYGSKPWELDPGFAETVPISFSHFVWWNTAAILQRH